MSQLKTEFECILAGEEEIHIYYEKSAQTINLLLEKYNTRDVNNQLETVSVKSLRNLLTCDGFFQETPLKSIFYDQKHQYVPDEIVTAFRNIISDAPLNIKAVFFETFLMLLIKKGWSEPLGQYLKQHYNFPDDKQITLIELKDFSLGFSVYKLTFQIGNEKAIVFLKRAHELRAYNELLYSQLQREFLSTAYHAKMSCILSNEKNEDSLLLSPLVPGITSEIFISILTYTGRNTHNSSNKIVLQSALENLIEAFVQHAALGDLLGRNDRHLLNSLIANVVDGNLQNITLEDLLTPAQVLACANNIVAAKENAISLIDIDLKWLLGEKNADWALADIDFGLSEINLLSLLPAFNDFNARLDSLFEKRKDYILRYYNVYCQTLQNMLAKKELIYSAIQEIYPGNVSRQKLNLLEQRINEFESSNKCVIEIFKRYLLNYRIRYIYKETLVELYKMANASNDRLLLENLEKAGLLKHLPSMPMLNQSEGSAFLQLQCFRGVLSKDSDILENKNREAWESVAANILIVTKKFKPNCYKTLEDKKRFIRKDTKTLLMLF